MAGQIKRFLSDIEKYAGAIMLITMVVVAFLQVVYRYILHWNVDWTEELVLFCFAWFVYMGAAANTGGKTHMKVEILYDRLPPLGQKLIMLLSDLLWLVCAVTLLYFNSQVTAMVRQRGAITVALHMPSWIGYASVTTGIALMIIRVLLNIYKDIKGFVGKDNRGDN